MPADEDSLELIDASRGQRFLNLLLDAFGISVTTTILVAAGFDVLSGGSAYLVTFGYYAGFEATLGQTPGKFVTGTKVLRGDGGTPSVAQILGRTMVRFILFEPLSFIFGRAGWHDRWTGTRVVRTRPSESDDGNELALAPDSANLAAAARRVRVIVGEPAKLEGADARSYRKLDPATRRVVCGVCDEEFNFGLSSCPRCGAEYRYTGGRPVLVRH